MRAERQDHHAVLGELIEQRLRQFLGGGGDDDAIIGRPARHAGKAVAGHDLDIVIAERRQPLARRSASVR